MLTFSTLARGTFQYLLSSPPYSAIFTFVLFASSTNTVCGSMFLGTLTRTMEPIHNFATGTIGLVSSACGACCRIAGFALTPHRRHRARS